ncbi:hypothetical protein PRIPAC_74465 [Pristionchus pacificus]|uniref:Prohibitin n=1 Tax=Pristionchus pacificus TaxID=54126 RepID=A0A2A6CA10_PRIPA|nr:hypothetical protein PRIPAC_74465 [Pristionchus pacificus]|eukprot:PDM75055.1 hypothetical protein PRIPAC_40436 [Pristionchus pacificus]
MAEQGNEAKEQELDCSLEPEHSRMELPKPCSLVSSLVTVDAGHRAIMSNRICGLSEELYKEGLHFRVPWFQYPIVYDIRARPNQIRSPTGSMDLQMFNIGLRVLSRPDPNHLTKIYRTRALDFNLIVDDFSLTELTFSPQYSVAVEAKQVAAQEAPRASFVVERAK